MKEVLVLLAHGSSDEDWARPFFEMTKSVRDQHQNVKLAFMELSEPSMDSVVANAVKDGATHVSVLPLFLAKGRHLKKDVPAMLENYQSQFGVSTNLLTQMGDHPALSKAIEEIILDHLK